MRGVESAPNRSVFFSNSILTIYKDLHSHPELSTREERSAGIVAKELRAAGCDVTENFGKYDNSGWKCYGVIGVMKNGAGPTVLVRTDLDALPVHEESALPVNRRRRPATVRVHCSTPVFTRNSANQSSRWAFTTKPTCRPTTSVSR